MERFPGRSNRTVTVRSCEVVAQAFLRVWIVERFFHTFLMERFPKRLHMPA